MSVLLLPLWVLSGAMFPARGGWIEPIALANPMTYAVSGARAALGGETSELLGPSAPTSVIVLAVFCVVAIAVAVWCARHLVTGRARRA